VGRHSAPPSEDRDPPRRPLYLAVTVAVVVLVLAVVALALALRGGDDGRTSTADPGSSRRPSTLAPSSAGLPSSGSLDPSVSASPTTSTPAAATTTPAPSATTSAPATSAAATTEEPKRAPTLRLEWLGTSYVRVRVGSRTVFEEIERPGTVRTFDQHSVTALIGNGELVRAVVNGKPHRLGAVGQVETIVARR
jgi:hypothetical protein